MIINNWYVFLISKIGGTVLPNMTGTGQLCAHLPRPRYSVIPVILHQKFSLYEFH